MLLIRKAATGSSFRECMVKEDLLFLVREGLKAHFLTAEDLAIEIVTSGTAVAPPCEQLKCGMRVP